MTADLSAMLAEIKAAAQARNDLAAQLVARAGGLRLHRQDGRKAAVTPELDGSSHWRITYIDARGPSGHTCHNDKLAAVSDALRSGYRPEGARA